MNVVNFLMARQLCSVWWSRAGWAGPHVLHKVCTSLTGVAVEEKVTIETIGSFSVSLELTKARTWTVVQRLLDRDSATAMIVVIEQ